MFRGTGLPASRNLVRDVASHVNSLPRISSAPRFLSTGFCASRNCLSRVRSGTSLLLKLLFMGGVVMWDPDKMLSNSQRYQKTHTVSGRPSADSGPDDRRAAQRRPTRRLVMCMAVSAGLLGCASAEAPASSAGRDAAPAARQVAGAQGVPAVDLRQALVPMDSSQATTVANLAPAAEAGSGPQNLNLVTPPVARQAVINAREAMRKKQWAVLDTLAPIAKADPVLGAYA
jgi:soluble lytic murein transglycosylase